MSLPRRLIPGTVHATSRRTTRRLLMLTPTSPVVEIVGYSVASGLANAPTVKVLAFMQSSTHEQAVFLDQAPAAKPGAPKDRDHPSPLPGLMGRIHSLQARALNAHFGRGGCLWDDDSYSNVEVHDQAALDEQLYYVWMQVVNDGLLSSPDLHPGFKIMPEDFGRWITVPRPQAAFFGGLRPSRALPTDPDALARHHAELARAERQALDLARERRRDADRKRGRTSKRRRKLEEGRERRRLRQEERRRELAREGKPERDRSTLPAFVTFQVGVPPGYEDWPIEEVRAHFRRGLNERVAAHNREFAAAGRTYMGLERMLAQDPRESAGDSWPTFAINPRIACKDTDTRIDALLGLRAWRAEMREKRLAWKSGKREVVFPRGAYAVWRFHGACVAGSHPGSRAPCATDPPGRDAPT